MDRERRVGAVRIRRTRLGDGRELLFFDDADDADAAPFGIDPRPAPQLRSAPEMRLDVFTGEWVVIAAHRMDRTLTPARSACPLCPAGPDREPGEIPAPDYDVVVFENRFPAFEGAPARSGSEQPDPFCHRAPAAGRCEVIGFCADHDVNTSALSAQRMRTVVDAWAHRTAALSAMPGVAQVCCFENRGPEIGVTLPHPHGQIYGYPFVPPRSAQLLTQARAHRQRTGGDLLGDLLAAERSAGVRLVHAGTHWTAFVPPAARWPAELRLVPHRAVPDLAGLDDAERDELAQLYPALLRRLDGYFADRGDPGPVPSVAIWHQAPVAAGRELVRCHLQLFTIRRAPGVLKYLAASETGAGAWLVDTVPEDGAARLREVAP